ncbi:hypothetical protein [Bradyrhizobium sp. NBAIM01]|uniref:hypothetical protein n=1 Tax=Bradyrhizobium sp. NBAIM01 TaxID=2793818 RepID=UPI001CD35730|nr:hypothetical protein [Bradyrhizobium sp. NBAIM01]MCA1510540.1 hypothetical protein [Bradyrhizobium sp. NBAIM01]
MYPSFVAGRDLRMLSMRAVRTLGFKPILVAQDHPRRQYGEIDAIIVREQVFASMRKHRGIVVLSVVISTLLYMPDQIEELYRIASDDRGRVTIKELVGLGVIALGIWAAASQLTAATLPHIPPDAGHLAFCIQAAVELGALPIVAVTVRQLAWRPAEKINEVEEVEAASAFRTKRSLRADMLFVLRLSC